MSESRFPQRLDIKDMPRDRTRSLGGLRQAICASFNYCRKYPAKMAVLKEVLKYSYNRIVQFEKELDKLNEEKERKAILDKAEAHGIDLDERLSNDKLEVELSDALAKKAAEEATVEAETATKAQETETKEGDE